MVDKRHGSALWRLAAALLLGALADIEMQDRVGMSVWVSHQSDVRLSEIMDISVHTSCSEYAGAARKREQTRAGRHRESAREPSLRPHLQCSCLYNVNFEQKDT